MSRCDAQQAWPQRVCAQWAWAKINLSLQVGKRGADGYHQLVSLVVFAGVGDRLVFAPRPGVEPEDAPFHLSCSGPDAAGVPLGEENMIARAWRWWTRKTGHRVAGRWRLSKALPLGAGFGGGSGDGAAALRLLSAVAPLARSNADEDPLLSAQTQKDLAQDLGCDVPVCYSQRPMTVRGIGERLLRAPPLPAAWFVLAFTGIPLATAKVFRQHAQRKGRSPVPASVLPPSVLPASVFPEVFVSLESLVDFLKMHPNDLEPPAMAHQPQIRFLLQALGATTGCLLARMSGSGAGCFGLYAQQSEAAAALRALGGRGWWLRVAPLLHGPLPWPWRAAAASGHV